MALAEYQRLQRDYSHMVSNRTVPRGMFIAPASTLAQLHARILTGPALAP